MESASPAGHPAALRSPRLLLSASLALGALGLHRLMVAVETAPAGGGVVGIRMDVVLGLVLALGLGRVILALLPPGAIGSHRPRDLAETAAASLLLGVGLLGTQRPPQLLFALAALVLAGIARALTLPGAMVPRHAMPEPRPGPGARLGALLLGLVALAPLVLVLRRPALQTVSSAAIPYPDLLGPLTWAALVVALERALAVARRPPAARRWLLALALVPALVPVGLRGSYEELACAAAAAYLVPWRRCAERRALWLSLLCLAFAGVGAPLLAGAGAALLLALSPPPTRRAVALRIGLLAALLAALRATPGALPFADLVPSPASLLPLAALGLGLALPAVSAGSRASRP